MQTKVVNICTSLAIEVNQKAEGTNQRSRDKRVFPILAKLLSQPAYNIEQGGNVSFLPSPSPDGLHEEGVPFHIKITLPDCGVNDGALVPLCDKTTAKFSQPNTKLYSTEGILERIDSEVITVAGNDVLNICDSQGNPSTLWSNTVTQIDNAANKLVARLEKILTLRLISKAGVGLDGHPSTSNFPPVFIDGCAGCPPKYNEDWALMAHTTLAKMNTSIRNVNTVAQSADYIISKMLASTPNNGGELFTNKLYSPFLDTQVASAYPTLYGANTLPFLQFLPENMFFVTYSKSVAQRNPGFSAFSTGGGPVYDYNILLALLENESFNSADTSMSVPFRYVFNDGTDTNYNIIMDLVINRQVCEGSTTTSFLLRLRYASLPINAADVMCNVPPGYTGVTLGAINIPSYTSITPNNTPVVTVTNCITPPIYNCPILIEKGTVLTVNYTVGGVANVLSYTVPTAWALTNDTNNPNGSFGAKVSALLASIFNSTPVGVIKYDAVTGMIKVFPNDPTKSFDNPSTIEIISSDGCFDRSLTVGDCPTPIPNQMKFYFTDWQPNPLNSIPAFSCVNDLPYGMVVDPSNCAGILYRFSTEADGTTLCDGSPSNPSGVIPYQSPAFPSLAAVWAHYQEHFDPYNTGTLYSGSLYDGGLIAISLWASCDGGVTWSLTDMVKQFAACITCRVAGDGKDGGKDTPKPTKK